MRAQASLPTGVLSQKLADAIGGRRVRAALFTTFSFDPGFFELHILPLLFDQSFSQVDKVRRIQLEDALRGIEEMAVYYDRSALSQDAEPAQLDYRRIDVSRATGCFHPKAVLLLVETPPAPGNPNAEPEESLLVSLQSANLTRAGWWENVECAHLEEIPSVEVSGERIAYRRDLMALLRQIRRSAPDDEDHAALDRIHEFLRHETTTEDFTRQRSKGRHHTRVFCGQDRQSFSEWLDELRLTRREWNLEVVSPYFDASGGGPLVDLVETLEPKETRVFLPRELDGRAAVSEATYEAIGEWAYWADAPSPLVARGRDGTSDRLPPRRVHAKLYRLWNRDGRDVLIVGSVNLTSPAHGDWGSGNLEAAFLVDVTGEKLPRRWWLTRIDSEPTRFTETTPDESEGREDAPIALSVRFDWAEQRLAYRLEEKSAPFRLLEVAGTPLVSVEKPRPGAWVELDERVGARMAEALRSTSFVRVEHPGGAWRVLVREENMGHRPSLLMQLTPEEILEYWSLLSADQRAGIIEEKLGPDAELEGLAVTRREALRSGGTMFDRFAGIYHAFGCLRRHVEEAIEDDRAREAEARLLGAKYDSLPCLLEKTLAQKDADPIVQYVTFLCARQARDAIRHAHRNLFSKNRSRTLDALLDQLPELRARVGESGIEEADAFLDWFEPAFLQELSKPGSR